MEIEIDKDVKKILEKMQLEIPTHRLIAVAEALPRMARLLWDKYPQEPVEPVRMVADPLSTSCEKPQDATG